MRPQSDVLATLSCWVAVAALFAGCSSDSPAEPDDDDPAFVPGLIAELSWLAGDWSFESAYCADEPDGATPESLGYSVALNIQAGGVATLVRNEQSEEYSFGTRKFDKELLFGFQEQMRFDPPLRIARWSFSEFGVQRAFFTDLSGEMRDDLALRGGFLCSFDFTRTP